MDHPSANHDSEPISKRLEFSDNDSSSSSLSTKMVSHLEQSIDSSTDDTAFTVSHDSDMLGNPGETWNQLGLMALDTQSNQAIVDGSTRLALKPALTTAFIVGAFPFPRGATPRCQTQIRAIDCASSLVLTKVSTTNTPTIFPKSKCRDPYTWPRSASISKVAGAVTRTCGCPTCTVQCKH